eukprot:12390285-Karenia_brevis.AAC.1
MMRLKLRSSASRSAERRSYSESSRSAKEPLMIKKMRNRSRKTQQLLGYGQTQLKARVQTPLLRPQHLDLLTSSFLCLTMHRERK